MADRADAHGHGHVHGLVDRSIGRSHGGAYVSLAVVASAAAVALGPTAADPVIGLAITLVIVRITWQSWHTVRGHVHAR